MERGKKRLFADAMLRLLWFSNCLNVRRNFTLSLHSKWCNSPCFLASFPFPIILTFISCILKFKSNALHLWWLLCCFLPLSKMENEKNGRAIIPLRWNMNAENHPSSRLCFDAVKRRSFLCATAAVENGSSLDETVFDFSTLIMSTQLAKIPISLFVTDEESNNDESFREENSNHRQPMHKKEHMKPLKLVSSRKLTLTWNHHPTNRQFPLLSSI